MQMNSNEQLGGVRNCRYWTGLVSIQNGANPVYTLRLNLSDITIPADALSHSG